MVEGNIGENGIWLDERRNGKENHSITISGLSTNECQALKELLKRTKVFKNKQNSGKKTISSLGFLIQSTVAESSRKFLINCGFVRLRTKTREEKTEEILFLRLRDAKGPLEAALRGLENDHKPGAAIAFLCRYTPIEAIDTTIQRRILKI